MFANITRTTLCLTAFSIASLLAAPLDATKTESLDWNWKFSRFGNMPDGSTLPEPGKALGFATATSEESGNPADNAVDGDKSTRWCADGGKSGEKLTVDMGRPVDVKNINILWEKQNNHLFKLESSSDGKRWTTIEDKTSGQNNSKDDTVENKGGKARYFRITSTGNNQGNWASIREITFTDAKGEPIRPQAPSGSKADTPSSPGFNDKNWRSLNLPHDWGIEGPYRMDLPNETGKLPWAGIGWYRKTLEIPADAKGNQFYLDFDGVMSRPKIYVNGELAGEWKYGYGSFRVDITPFLKFGGKNTIAVRVDNPPNSSRWYPGGGIHRHVWLTESNPVHIEHWGVFVKTPEITKSAARVEVDTTVKNTTKQPITPTVTEEILDGDKVVATTTTKGEAIPAGEKSKVTSTLTLKNPTLWTLKAPHLYKMKTIVKVGDKVIDQKLTNFGVRTIEWKPTGFYLNGERVQLKGVCQHHDLGPLGGAAHTRGYERQIEILKEMGVNSIRTSHNPPAPEVLDLCDKMGILVIDELFDMWHSAKKGQDYHNYFDEWHERDLVNFCHRDRNHPSVIAWSTGNEVPEQGNKNLHHVSQTLTDLFHREDPTRKVTAGCNDAGAARNGFGDTMDVYGYNYKPWAYKAFSKDRPDQPFYASETSSCVSTRGEYFFPVDWNKSKGFFLYQVSSYDLYAPGWAYRPDVEFAAQDDNPNSAGEYVWTGFDYLGEPTPYNLDATNALNVPEGPEREKMMAELKKLGNRAPSRSSYFGIVDLCGFKKDRFYIYQAHWRPDVKMAHILPHWNWPERKGEITPVHVYTSGDEAELFLNGKSLGVRKKGNGEKDRYRLVWEDVKYTPGTLKVVAKRDGKAWATDTVTTTGKPAALTLKPDRTEIKGDGYDLSYVTVAVRDAQGRMVPRSKNMLTFKVSGPAEIAGICNGDPTDFTTMANPENKKIMKIKAFNGLAQVILRSRKGESGKVTLQVISNGLKPAQTAVTVK